MAAAVCSPPPHPAYSSTTPALAYHLQPSNDHDDSSERHHRKVNVQMSSKIQQLLGENPMGTTLTSQTYISPEKPSYNRLKKKPSTLSLHFENLMNTLSLNPNSKAPSVQILSESQRSYNASPIDRSPDSPVKTFNSHLNETTTYPRSLRSTKPHTVSRLTREDYPIDTLLHTPIPAYQQSTSTIPEHERSPKRKLRDSGLIKLNFSSKQRSRGGTLQSQSQPSEVSTLRPTYRERDARDIPLTQEQLNEELTAPRRERVRKTRQGVQQWLNEAEFDPEDVEQLISPSDSATSVLTLHSQKPGKAKDGHVPAVPGTSPPASNRPEALSNVDLNSQSILLFDSDGEDSSLDDTNRRSKDKLFSDVSVRDDGSIYVSTNGSLRKRHSNNQAHAHLVPSSTYSHSRSNSGNPRQLKSAHPPNRPRKSSVRSDRSSLTLKTHSAKSSGSYKRKPTSLNLGRTPLSIPTLLTPDEYDAPSAPLPRLPTSDLHLRSPSHDDRIRSRHLSVIDDDAFSESSVKTDLLIPSPRRATHDEDSASDTCTPIIDAFPVPPSNRSQASLGFLPQKSEVQALPFVSGPHVPNGTTKTTKPISLDTLLRSGASTFTYPRGIDEKTDTITALPLMPGVFGAPSLSPKLSPRSSAERVPLSLSSQGKQAMPIRLSTQLPPLQTSLLSSPKEENPYSANLKRMSRKTSGTLSWIPPSQAAGQAFPKRVSKTMAQSASAPSSAKIAQAQFAEETKGKASSSTFPSSGTFENIGGQAREFNFQLPLPLPLPLSEHDREQNGVRPKTRGRMTVSHNNHTPAQNETRAQDHQQREGIKAREDDLREAPPAIPRQRSNKEKPHLPARSISSEMVIDRAFEWRVPIASPNEEKKRGIGLAV